MKTDDPQLRPPSSESLAAGYETSGVNVKALALLVVGMGLCGAGIHAGAWYVHNRFFHAEQAREISYSVASPSAVPAPRIQPSEPNNTLPRQDLLNMYAAEDEVFRRMGWKVDPVNHAQVEIPANVMAPVIREATQRQNHP